MVGIIKVFIYLAFCILAPIGNFGKTLYLVRKPALSNGVYNLFKYTKMVSSDNNIKSMKKSKGKITARKTALGKIDFKKMGGIVPAVVQDVKTNKVLMVGFMDREALKKTLDGDKVVYWSRSREKYWTKGETSGNCQFFKEIWLDCDKDTILIKAKQVGNVCHTGSKTCFFHKIYGK